MWRVGEFTEYTRLRDNGVLPVSRVFFCSFFSLSKIKDCSQSNADNPRSHSMYCTGSWLTPLLLRYPIHWKDASDSCSFAVAGLSNHKWSNLQPQYMGTKQGLWRCIRWTGSRGTFSQMLFWISSSTSLSKQATSQACFNVVVETNNFIYLWNISYVELRIWNQVSYDHRSYERNISNCMISYITSHLFLAGSLADTNDQLPTSVAS